MKETKRTLHLKYGHFRSGRSKTFVPTPLDQLVLKVQAAAPNFAQRHYPPPSALPPGTSCAFLENIRKRKSGDGVLFDVYAYTYGMASEQFHPDFASAKPDISTGQIKDSSGKVREIVHAYKCLAWGQAIIVEYNRAAHGVHLLESLLNYVLHRHCQKDMPRLSLVDVMTNQLDKAIAAGGGVDELSLGLIGGSKPKQGAYVSERLVELKERVKKTKQVRVVWEAADEALDTSNVIGFYPVSTDGLIKAENLRSRRATLRRIRGLWNRSI